MPTVCVFQIEKSNHSRFVHPYISFKLDDVVDLRYFNHMNSDGSNNLSLKYQSFTLSGCGDLVIKKLAFVVKTQFL